MAATDFRDYYGILGLSKTANVDEIKKTYRKLARQYHPDVNPNNRDAEARFKEVTEAYEVLSDPEKRAKYDQFGQYWKQAESRPPSGAGPWSSNTNSNFENFEFSQYGSFDEFINELLGQFGSTPSGTTRTRTPRSPGVPSDFGASGFDRTPGAALDQEAIISLTLGEAFHGAKKRLSLGSETIEGAIPAGVKPGSRIRLRGKGQTNPANQQRGDLYLVVEIQPHPFFKFEGEDLVCEVPIAPDEAVLGGQIDVPTPDGTVKMNIPPGIKSGQSLRLRGKGWPQPKGGRTDQLVRVVITPPKTLSEIERECYEKIKANRTIDPRNDLKQVKL